MKNCKRNNHIKKVNQAVIGGLSTFLIIGLGGCEDKDPNCKDLAYAPQWRIDECKQQEAKTNSYAGSGSHNSSQNHSAGSSWLPLWLLMNNSNNSNNAHSGYTYGSSDGPKNNGFFKSNSSSSGG